MGRLARDSLSQAGLTRLSLRASQAEEASVLTGREEATIQLSVAVRTLVCCPSTRRSNSWPNQWCGEPFTIQLCFETTTYTQPITVGVDTGSHTVGIAATANREVVFQAEMRLCTDISGKLTQRRQYRRTRRARKTRYRAARWANRRRSSGWLAPSLRARAEATVKAVCFVARVLPIGQINVEIGSFDTQQMQNPEVSGASYQQGQLAGYLLREYLLAKWQRQCAYCQTSGVPLQVEHLMPKSRGGSDSASNLVIACEPCNKGKGSQTAEEFGYPEIQAQARVPLTDAAHVSSIKTAVVQSLAQQFGAER